MPKRLPEQTWYAAAARKIVRNGLSLRQAAQELGHALAPEEAERISKLDSFQKVMWTERNTHNTEIANSPGNTKNSLIGQMLFSIEQLKKEGNYKDAIDAMAKLARIQGWDKGTEINVFAGVTSADIEAEKAKLRLEIEGVQPVRSDKTSLSN